MGEYAEGGIYVNFVAEPSAERAIEGGFGEEKYARVAAVKESTTRTTSSGATPISRPVGTCS